MKRLSLKKACSFQGLIIAISLLFLLSSNASAFNSGSTGADGAFNPTTNTQVQLPADGKLNYTTVDIPTGVTVTFIKNANNTPVYILATGGVSIAGAISVNGADAGGMFPGGGGPGGYDGGLGGTPADGANPALSGGKGMGPGSGDPGSPSTNATSSSAGGGGGGFGFSGNDGAGNTYASKGIGGTSYGNASIIPMIGGSGGGGGAGSANTNYKNTGGGGGGGGGAILIASSGTFTITGSITANGGNGGSGTPLTTYSGGGGGGAGGAIKLMADTIAGNGTISATGGAYGSSSLYGGAGGNGRVRLEANTITRTAAATPISTYSYPGTVFVTNVPTLTITSIGGVNVPANPAGTFGSPDIILPSTITNPVTVDVTATNIPDGTSVTVTAAPEYGASASATGTLASSTASVSINLSTGYQSILTAQAMFTVQQALFYDGEKIEKVRVAATMKKQSEAVYITEKGREIKAADLMAKLAGW